MDILARFKETGALLEGNFILTSGLYSHQYMQCAKLLQYPNELEFLSNLLADRFKNDDIDFVISPAIGGIVLGTEVGRQLGVKTIFAERDGEGRMQLRRGFEINKGDRGLVVEDVVTTGGSVEEVIQVVRNYGGNAFGVGFIVDRSNGVKKFDVEKQHSLLKIEVTTYTADTNPLGIASAVKPGSRKI
jgi:orotate phosphoribosyltransferase